MDYDIPAFSGTITTLSGTQGHPVRECTTGYTKGGGKWCPYCKADGKFHWIELHSYCVDHPTNEDVHAKDQWERECMESWGIK